MRSLNEQLEILKRGAVEVIPEDEFEQKLKKSIENNRPLIVKAGFDPSAPDLHLGHTVPFRKLQSFIECGHKVVVIIGDYTAMIGDPTGKSKTRKQLSEEEVKKNAQTYIDQVSKVLDIDKAEIVFNSKWLSKLDLKSIIELTAKQTVARMLERDDFFKRYKKGDDISMVEFMYPLMQAYDSVALKADIELGGTDQKFNLLLGRTIQKRYDQDGQVILTMPLLEGTDGVEKMSKSLGNYIGIDENSKDMFGKLMSIPDEMIIKYLELLTDIKKDVISGYQEEMKKGRNPKEIKEILAIEVVAQYYNRDTAEKEKKNFELLFSKKIVHNDIPEGSIISALGDDKPSTVYNVTSTAVDILNLGLSGSEIKRQIKNGAVSYNDKKMTDMFQDISKELEEEIVIKIGKKNFFRHKP